MQQEYKLKHGKPYPSGSTFDVKGVNFSIFSRYAEQVEILLFYESDSDTPFQVIQLKKISTELFFLGMFIFPDCQQGLGTLGE